MLLQAIDYVVSQEPAHVVKAVSPRSSAPPTLALALALALTLTRYAMRADSKFDLDLWHEVCNRNGRMWLQARG